MAEKQASVTDGAGFKMVKERVGNLVPAGVQEYCSEFSKKNFSFVFLSCIRNCIMRKLNHIFWIDNIFL